MGVTIDNKLKWTAHIQYIKNNLSKSVGILYKCRKYVDKETTQDLYFSFIYPYLIYCVENSQLSLRPYRSDWKQCIRTITYSSYLEHPQPLCNKLKNSNLEYFANYV